MTFLQPYLLFALPLIALPILIHLINQNRHKTIHWAATMFLLQAKRMSRGMARLRYLLIMLARMLAIAGLIFAVSRPMAGGWLGFTAGSKPETTIIILDRSASMEEQGHGSTLSKRETALRKLAELIENTGNKTQLILLESAHGEPQVIRAAKDLLDLPDTGPSSTTADIPTLLERATEYIVTNETGRTDVWICSDLRQNDWNPAGGRWETIRQQLSEREGVRLYLLNYATRSPANLAVSVAGVHRRESTNGAELIMDIRLTRDPPFADPEVIPLNFVINGARSILEVEMNGSELIRSGHTIPLAKESRSGWGRIEIPGDANLLDNTYRFVYSEPAIQKSVIVSDDREISEVLELIATSGVDQHLLYQAEIVTSAAAATLPWKEAGLILWQAPLPTDVLAEQLNSYVASGRSVIFFPPETPDATTFQGVQWTAWSAQDPEDLKVQRWRTDSGLLENTLSGAPLPVGELEIFKYCSLEHHESTILAQLPEGIPLVLRTNSNQGAAYFCSTLPSPGYSNLTSNGIVFYIMIHRALSRGAAMLGSAQQLTCGHIDPVSANDWRPLDDLSAEQLLSQRAINAGLYVDQKDVRIALNRPLVEDESQVVSEESLASTLNGINYTSINDEAGSAMALASEVWRSFLIIMIAALLLEGILCLPDRPEAPKLVFARPTPTSS